MHHITPLASAFLLVLALLVAACGGGEYQSGETGASTDTTAAPMEMASSVTLTGTIVDAKCYGMNHANTGNDHTMADGSTVPGCGSACASMGIPVALYEGGQAAKAYVLLMPASSMAQHIAKEARVTGTTTFGSGLLPTKVEVKDAAGAWVDVTPGTMM